MKPSILETLKGFGTPKDLDEAIMQAMSCGPARDFPENMKAIFEDFLRQRFAVALFKVSNKEEEKLLFDLLSHILGKKVMSTAESLQEIINQQCDVNKKENK